MLNFTIWPIIKILFLFGIGVYVVFSAVVVRQVALMTDTLAVGFETPVRVLAILHFLLAIGAFILAFVVL
jgi:hypothetical protein